MPSFPDSDGGHENRLNCGEDSAPASWTRRPAFVPYEEAL
jgi:hypothetical protein